jgi:anti-anti-sigma factor
MPLRQEPDGILILDLADEPQFSADLQALSDRLRTYGPASVVVNMSAITLLNSSQWAALVQLRTRLNAGNKRMLLAAVPSRLQAALKMSGLDRAFTCAPDLKSARVALQAPVASNS